MTAPDVFPPEAVERALQAIAEGLRRKHPDAIVEVLPAGDVLDAAAPASDGDADPADTRSED